MDRTREFQSLLAPRANTASVHSAGELDGRDSLNAGSNARSGFNAEAARIGQEIHIAQLKLDELGKGMHETIEC